MTSQHKHPPLSYRPPKDSGDEAWLREHSEQTGRSVNAILADAVSRYRAQSQDPDTTDPKEQSMKGIRAQVYAEIRQFMIDNGAQRLRPATKALHVIFPR